MSERYQLEETGSSENSINFFEKSIEQIITLQNTLLSNIQKTIQPIIARERAKINEVQEGAVDLGGGPQSVPIVQSVKIGFCIRSPL